MLPSVVQRERESILATAWLVGGSRAQWRQGAQLGAVSVILAAEDCSWAYGGHCGELEKNTALETELTGLVDRFGIGKSKEKIA